MSEIRAIPGQLLLAIPNGKFLQVQPNTTFWILRHRSNRARFAFAYAYPETGEWAPLVLVSTGLREVVAMRRPVVFEGADYEPQTNFDFGDAE